MLEELRIKILELYNEMDQESQAFKKLTGIHCLAQCGKCCQNPQVSATMLEMLPLALFLIENGYDDKEERSPTCQFFKADPTHPDRGSCGVYAYRPIVCRLFGWMATIDKNTQPRLSTCDLIKNDQQNLVKTIQEDTSLLEKLPVITQWKEKFLAIDPSWGRDIYPVNVALKLTLEKVLLIKRLSAQSHQQLVDNTPFGF